MLNNKLHEEKNELQTSKDILHDDFIQLQKDNYSFQSQIESMNIRQMEAEIEKASKEVGTEESSADVHEDHSTENGL